jgi:VanZ family protein
MLKAARITAWLLVATIVVLSLVPPGLRPATNAPHNLEHFAIFAATGFALGLGYGKRFYRITVGLAIFAGAVEVAQLFVAGRHARFTDFIVDALSACIGLFVAAFFLRRKLDATLEPRSPHRKRVLVVASGGGHWIQMRRLQPAFDGLNVAFASVYPAYAEEVSGHRFYTVRDVTRWDRWGLLVLVTQLVTILMRERPHVVLTTGSAPGMITLALAKLLLRSKTIWIDSIANCEQMSFSGAQARRFSDAWLTQWPQLQRAGGPDYWGAVL